MKIRATLLVFGLLSGIQLAAPFCLASGPALERPSPQVIVETRIVEVNRDSALLIGVNWTGKGSFDELKLTPGPSWLKGLGDLHLPPGWERGPGAESLDLHGPALATPAYFRLDSSVKPPDRIVLEILSEGSVLFSDKKVPVLSKPAVVTLDNLASVISLPHYVLPADWITFKPLDPKETPVAGQWTIGGVPARYVPEAGHYEFKLPSDWAGGGLPIAYVDPFGFKLYDNPNYVDLKVEPVVRPDNSILMAITPMVMLGDTACATGYFPDWKSRAGILINGAPVPDVYSSSSLGLVLGLGQDIKPGQYTLGCDPAAGFGAKTELPLTIIDVSGDVDRNKLMKGESTPLRLHVIGTQDPVELNLVNLTPTIISLSDGDKQVVTTSGGAQNDAVRTVRGLKKGDFDLSYTLTLDRWPDFKTPVR